MFVFTEVNLKAGFNPVDSGFDFFPWSKAQNKARLRQENMYDMS